MRTRSAYAGRTLVGMWMDEMDGAPRGVVHPAQGPLGRAVRALRHDLFLSQSQVADMVGASQAAVSRLERGAPAWRLFCRIVDATGGVAVVTVEPKATERELYDRYFGPNAAA